MNKKIGEDGRMIILPPTVKDGESIDLLAEMDLLIAISACPSGKLRPITSSRNPLDDRFHGTYPPNFNEGTHPISGGPLHFLS
jgi:uncharacterized protein YcgI (DUF1989 family)